ncbi:Uncharacterized protein Rs2_07846 [Raphanus sativus]|nr:Uncharacterized protein Rs2_07846 [Raphanus sativus]
MAKTKPPKNKPSARLPTGTATTSNRATKSSTPDASSAVKSKSPLAGSAAQTPLSSPAQNPSTESLAKQTESPNSETLATVPPTVPGNQDRLDTAPPVLANQDQPHAAPTDTGNQDQLNAASTDTRPPSPPPAGLRNSAEIWKGFVKESSETAKRKGKAPINSLLPIVGKQKMVYKQVGVKIPEPPVLASTSTPDVPREVPPDVPPPPEDFPPLLNAVPATLESTSSPKTGCTTTVEHDLSKGSLFVDLTDESKLQEQSSTGSSSDSTFSADEDNPDEEDEFLEVYTKRYQKRNSAYQRS